MTDTPSAEFFELQQVVAGRYSLDREIGRGGMGIVFLARDVALDRPVAIKLLPPGLARSEVLRNGFLREARTAAKLSHPNIVPIHAVEEHGELVFFVMTYVDGETLTDLLRRKGPMRTRDAARVIRDVAWALGHAHGQGVVHRDVKADNILIEAGSRRALVTDFGIAQLDDGSATDEGSSPDEQRIMGTPEFMSPEQALGHVVDDRSDIYSLGVVAFLTLTGRFPFAGKVPAELLAQHVGARPPLVADVAPTVPRRLSDLVDRCLAKTPAQRIASANEVAAAVDAALEARRELPVAVRLFVEESKTRERHWPALAYSLVALTLIPFLFIPAAIPRLIGLTGVSLALLLPPLHTIHRIRRVLRAGHDRDDVVHGFVQDLDSRREELDYLYGHDHQRTARRLRKVAFGTLGVAAASFAAMVALPDAIPLLSGVAIMSGLVGAATGLPADRRSDRKARARLKFWRGKIASWLFRTAQVGLEVRAPSPALTHRPTELAIGAAVESLFSALPRETRRALADLPGVVRQLEADAQEMRSRVEEFDRLLSQTVDTRSDGEAMPDPVAAKRRRAVERIRAVRGQAQQRLRDAVAALETLRVDLLQMNAGHASVRSVTTNLGSAKDLAEDIGRLLEGHEEIRRILEDDVIDLRA
jgi:eukaryotic-like serine/threonine-protein kinase